MALAIGLPIRTPIDSIPSGMPIHVPTTAKRGARAGTTAGNILDIRPAKKPQSTDQITKPATELTPAQAKHNTAAQIVPMKSVSMAPKRSAIKDGSTRPKKEAPLQIASM